MKRTLKYIYGILFFFCFATGINAAAPLICDYETEQNAVFKFVVENGTITYSATGSSISSVSFTSSLKVTDFQSSNGNLKCLEKIYWKQVDTGFSRVPQYNISSTAPSENSVGIALTSASGETELLDDEIVEEEVVEDTNNLTENSCSIFGEETTALVKSVYNTIKLLIPVLIIIFSIIDFLKVVISSDEKIYSQVWSKFMKRIVIAIAFFTVPALIKILLTLSDITGIYNIDVNNIFCIFM